MICKKRKKEKEVHVMWVMGMQRKIFGVKAKNNNLRVLYKIKSIGGSK